MGQMNNHYASMSCLRDEVHFTVEGRGSCLGVSLTVPGVAVGLESQTGGDNRFGS